MEESLIEIKDETLLKIDQQDIRNGMVSLPSGLKNIAPTALSNCATLTSLIIPEGVQLIEHGAFCLNKNLTTVKLPGTIKRISKEAFYGCRNLQAIMLPEGLEILGLGVFSSCTSLETLSLPSTLKVFPERLVFGCSQLKSIVLPECLETVEDDFLSGWAGQVSLTIRGENHEGIAILGGLMLSEKHWQEEPYDIYYGELYHAMEYSRWKTRRGWAARRNDGAQSFADSAEAAIAKFRELDAAYPLR